MSIIQQFQNCLNLLEQQMYEQIQAQQTYFNSITDVYESSMQKTQKSLDKFNASLNRQVPTLYDAELCLAHPLELPLYKGRIFFIRVKLMRLGQVIDHQIEVQLQVMTADKKMLTQNNKGEPLIIGNTIAKLRQGRACLSKLQIKEVSSHFPKGSFTFLVVALKEPRIKPLTLSDVQIKAKKFPDRHFPYYAKTEEFT